MSDLPAGVSFRDYSVGDRSACLAVFDSNVPKYFHHNERPEFEAFVDSFEGSYFVLETGGSVGAANLIVPETQFRWLAGEALAGRYVHVSA